MQIVLPAAEALELAAATRPLPPFVREVDVVGSTVELDIDLQRVPGLTGAVRFVASAVGTVAVTLRYAGFADGVATFAVTSRARSLPLHSLLNALTDTATSVLRQRGLADLLEVRPGTGGEPVVALHLQRAVAERADGVTVTAFDVRDAAFHVTVRVERPRFR